MTICALPEVFPNIGTLLVLLDHYTGNEARCYPEDSPLSRSAHLFLVSKRLLRLTVDVPLGATPDWDDYRVTDRGNVFVEFLKVLPLPVEQYVMPSLTPPTG